jgi:hypothetical protein
LRGAGGFHFLTRNYFEHFALSKRKKTDFDFKLMTVVLLGADFIQSVKVTI